MLVLFGFGRETSRDHGATVPVICPNCHNAVHLHLVEVKKWFSLFFIPLFPYEWTYWLKCPTCSRGIELDDEQFERAKRVCRARRLFRQRRITEQKYERIVQRSRLLEYANRKLSAPRERQ